MKKEIKEGERIPRGYGFCWFNWNRNTSTIAIIPFNFVFRWSRFVYFKLSKPALMKYEEKIYQNMREKIDSSFENGMVRGRQKTIKQVGHALEKGMDGLKEMIDEWVKEGFYFDK